MITIGDIDDNFWRRLDALCFMYHERQDEVFNGQRYYIEQLIRDRADVSEQQRMFVTAELVVLELYNHRSSTKNNNAFVDAVEQLLWEYAEGEL